jgi:uncharacterized membrane protein YgcG
MLLKKVVSRALLVLLVGAGPALVVSSPAHAYTKCDTEVVDGGRLFAGWVDTLAGGSPITDAHSKVLDAALKLREVGATVRVVTMANGYDSGLTPDPSLRKWCPAWFDGDKLKSDYIVFAAVDDMGLTGISYGSKWADALSPQLRGRTVAERISEDIMTPPFYDYEYANGFVNAIHETYRIITGRTVVADPAPFTQQRPTSLDQVESSRKQMFADAAAAGSTGSASSAVPEGYWSPRRLVGLVVVAALGVVGVLWLMRSRRSKSGKL